MTYLENDADDLCEKLVFVMEHHQQVKEQTQLHGAEDNIVRTGDWLLEESPTKAKQLTQDFANAD